MTIDVEIRDAPGAAGNVSASPQQASVTERIRRIWALFVVGLGLFTTMAWIALLGWLLYRAALMLVA